MKNKKIQISNKWEIKRDEFHEIDPLDLSIKSNVKYDNLYCQEDLFFIKNGEYNIDLGWYGNDEKGAFQLFLYKGLNWHNCMLLEKIQTKNYLFVTDVINNIAQNVDSGFYDQIKVENSSIDDFSNIELVSEFQITHTLIKLDNKVEALRYYLEANKKDDEGDSWTFGHNPNIIEHLNTFNEYEYEKLEIESKNWDDEVIGNLADAIYECGNPIIKGNYFYCCIFLQIDLFEELEYLIQNLGAISVGIEKKKPVSFYDKLIDKVIMVNDRLDNNYLHTVNQLKKVKAENIR